MKILMVLFSVLLAGCMPSLFSEQSLAYMAAEKVECQAGRLAVSDRQGGEMMMGAVAPETWTVTGCDRVWDCERITGQYVSRTSCVERPASKAATLQKVVKDRLALETGCPPEQIEVQSTAAWQRGEETAYRLRGCGKPYVCTTAPGRTDCKAALSE